jgi:ferredoxin
MNRSKQNEEITRSIQKISKELLEHNEVDLVIGYTEGTVPLNTIPYIAKNAEEAENLIWNNLCHINLAKYIPSIRDLINLEDNKELKVGVVAKGCVARALNHLIVENQINPNEIRIIGIECNGILNRTKILNEIQNREILEIFIEDEDIVVKGRNFEERFPYKDFLMSTCNTCNIKAPPNSGKLSELVIGSTNSNKTIDDQFEDVIEFENKTPDERWEEIKTILSPCIRCYACREACPLCYCNLCFVDQNMPRWFGKTTQLSDIMVFHIIRALHSAGRCVSCGACSSACPMGIDLSLLTRKLKKISKDRFDFTSGLDLETLPPMMCYEMEDREEFMLKEE